MTAKKIMHTNKRIILLGLALVFAVCLTIGGTVAWLMSKSDPVVNTFTYGDINITLNETDTNDGDNDPNTNNYEMIPGNEITKDPVVTVKANSVDNWLFVKLDKSANYDDFMTYTIADGWTKLADEDNVYYREVSKSDTDQTFHVIKDDKVTVLDTVTKAMLNALDADPQNATYPTLTITSYSVQKANIDTAAAAWNNVKNI